MSIDVSSVRSCSYCSLVKSSAAKVVFNAHSSQLYVMTSVCCAVCSYMCRSGPVAYDTGANAGKRSLQKAQDTQRERLRRSIGFWLEVLNGDDNGYGNRERAYRSLVDARFAHPMLVQEMLNGGPFPMFK
jgi:hypothetical protein